MSMTLTPSKQTGPAVWDRLWRHEPTDDVDDALLAREEGSGRWSLIVGHLQATFGRIAGLRTIELGSGRGDLSALLAKHKADVTLLDASEKALAQARNRFDRLGLRAQFETGDLFAASSISGAAFDVTLSSGVIEHFAGQDRTSVLRAHYEPLCAGGMSIISVPHARCIPYRAWKFYLELRRWWPYGMEIPYSRGELVRRAKEAGFAETRATCLGFKQSLGGQWARMLTGRRPSWTDHASVFDSRFGLTLLLFAHRSENGSLRGSVGETNAQTRNKPWDS